jgi:hypothetical protein
MAAARLSAAVVLAPAMAAVVSFAVDVWAARARYVLSMSSTLKYAARLSAVAAPAMAARLRPSFCCRPPKAAR